MKQVLVDKLVELAERDPRIYLITGDLGFGALEKFKELFPDRYVNAGVAEQNMTGLATGIALAGNIVFTYSIANFPILRCLEQIRNDACYHDANVKIAAIGGGFSYGALGISHHATEDISILRALPGMTVVCPGDKWEAGEAVEAVAKTPGACYLRLDKSAAPDTNSPNETFKLGKARTIREGEDATLIATGGILGEALLAADRLSKEGIKCRVLSMHTVKPLDRQAVLDAGSQTGGIVTIEEHTVDGGLGSAVAETCLELGASPGFFYRIGLRDTFSSVVGSQAYLRGRYGIDADSIAGVVKQRVALPLKSS